jgi:AraC-like DNA-binding protein
MVDFSNIPVPSKLTPFVKTIWAVEGDGAEEYVHRSIALEQCYMVFHYKGTFDEIKKGKRFKYPVTHVQGQTKKFRIFSTTKSFGLFGINFYPFIIPLMFHFPAVELTDEVSDFHNLLGPSSKELEEKMMLATDNVQRVKIISDFLEIRLLSKDIKDPAIHQAIRYISNVKHPETVAQLAEKFNCSKRQFERKFKAYAGLTPKLYSRIARFREALLQCENNTKSLSEIAHSCGYYDQAHFNHDFREFSGFQPKEILGTRDGIELL